MDKVVMIIGKKIKAEGKKEFTAYSALSSGGFWYRIAKIDPKQLEPYDHKAAKLDVTRLFDKDITTKEGKEVSFPTLVVESVSTPSAKEETELLDAIRALNEKTLKDFK